MEGRKALLGTLIEILNLVATRERTIHQANSDKQTKATIPYYSSDGNDNLCNVQIVMLVKWLLYGVLCPIILMKR